MKAKPTHSPEPHSVQQNERESVRNNKCFQDEMISEQYLEIMLFMLGSATPSAAPRRILIARRAHKEVSAAQGVRNVAIDHRVTPHAMTSLPP